MKRKKNIYGDGSFGSHPFEDIGKLLVPAPQLLDVSPAQIATEDLEKRAQAVRENASRIKDWVRLLLEALAKAASLSREAREEMTGNLPAAQQELERLLHREEKPAYRRAAWTGLLEHYLSVDIQSAEQVQQLFDDLVAKGYLQESPEGQLKVCNKVYAVPKEAEIGDPEYQVLAKLLDDIVERIGQAEKCRRREVSKGLREQSEMTFQEFLAGKAGKFFLNIPPEEVRNKENGTNFWRCGGGLLLENRGGDLWPLGAVGSQGFQSTVEEAINLEIFLQHRSLFFNHPPFIRALSQNQGRKVQLLWHLIQRGIRAAKEEEERLAQRQALKTRATVSMEKFFLQGEEGVCLVEFQGIWHAPENNSASWQNVYFLVERQGGIIRLIEAPNHLNDLVGELVDRSFKEEERFGRIPYPLGALLQAVYGQCQKAAQITAKSPALAGDES